MAEQPSKGFAKTLKINGQEILVTEQNASLQSYSREPRYDHLRISLGGSAIVPYFLERGDFYRQTDNLALRISREPDNYIRECYWESFPEEAEMTEADLHERRHVMANHAARQATGIIARLDMDAGLRCLVG